MSIHIAQGWGADRALLKRSTGEWNLLRRKRPDYIPQLSDADLEGLDLRGVNLSRADLRGAYFNGASLERANLRGADLRRAHLTDCDLTAADLKAANLRYADLRGAVLARASLEGANLVGTILDPERWPRELLKLWNAACPERKQQLVEALRHKAVLHRGWSNEGAACPEAILSDRGGESDDFMSAWSTFAITEEQVLRVLGTEAPLRARSATGGWTA